MSEAPVKKIVKMKFNRQLILASSSPRRQYLMQEAGFSFQVRVPDIDESFASTMAVSEVPNYLAEKKARVFEARLGSEVVVASDTVVILSNQILNKPEDRAEAIAMLNRLSGETHTVITAVCLLAREKMICFDDRTEVTFYKLSQEQIALYVDTYKPFDKAGAYGAQDCLPAEINPCSPEEIEFLKSINRLDLIQKTITPATTGPKIEVIEKITGSYFTVMGLPIHLVYSHLNKF